MFQNARAFACKSPPTPGVPCVPLPPETYPDGDTNGDTLRLANEPYRCENLRVRQARKVVCTLLSRTISLKQTRREPIIFLSPMQRVGQTVGHFSTVTCEASLPKTWRILLRALYPPLFFDLLVEKINFAYFIYFLVLLRMCALMLSAWQKDKLNEKFSVYTCYKRYSDDVFRFSILV